jgi:hypothetical protein
MPVHSIPTRRSSDLLKVQNNLMRAEIELLKKIHILERGMRRKK